MIKQYIIIMIICISWGCNKEQNDKLDLENSLRSTKESIEVNIGNQKKEIKFNFNEVRKRSRTRDFRKYEIHSIFSIGGIDNETFLLPADIKIDKFGNIYVLDFLDCSVKKFDETGKYIKKYGKKGRGPGEFTNGFYFDVDEDGRIALINPNDNKFAVFDKEKVFEYKTKLTPGRVCFVTNNEVVTFQFMDPFSFSPFQRINYLQNDAIQYQNIFDTETINNEALGMLPFLIGDIHHTESNNLIYISSILGYVIVYSNEGLIKNVFKLIEDATSTGTEINKSKKGNRNIINFPRKEEYIFASSNVFQDDLFVFLMPTELQMEAEEFVVDIYSLSERSYKYSLLLKNIGIISKIFISDKRIYITKENTEVEVFKYKLKNDNES